MTKIEIDMIQPNLLVTDLSYLGHTADKKDVQAITIGLDATSVIPACRAIDEIVAKNIGQLRVSKADMDTKRDGRAVYDKRNLRYEFPLGQYLDLLEKELNKERQFSSISKGDASLFGCDGNVVASATHSDYEGREGISDWYSIRKWLSDFDKDADNLEENFFRRVFKIDRKSTKERMEAKFKALDEKLSENYSTLCVIPGTIVLHPYRLDHIKYVGRVELANIKEKGKEKLEETKSKLIDALKEFSGPCLSLDAPSMVLQMNDLEDDAEKLIRKYGDIIVPQEKVENKLWRTRLFRFDP